MTNYVFNVKLFIFKVRVQIITSHVCRLTVKHCYIQPCEIRFTSFSLSDWAVRTENEDYLYLLVREISLLAKNLMF